MRLTTRLYGTTDFMSFQNFLETCTRFQTSQPVIMKCVVSGMQEKVTFLTFYPSYSIKNYVNYYEIIFHKLPLLLSI